MNVDFLPNNYLRIPRVTIDMSKNSDIEIFFTSVMTIYLVTIIITSVIMMNTAIHYNHPKFFNSFYYFYFLYQYPLFYFL
jgi:hypothetical protein